MAASTPTDIANMALALLTEAPIDSLDEDTRAARMMRLHYEVTRESELTKRVWYFTLVSAVLPAISEADGWSRYELPADCLRVPSLSGERVFEQRADGLWSDRGGDLALVYVGNIIDPNDWPGVFTDVLAAALAIKVAHSITGKASMIEVVERLYQNALSAALRVNAVQRENPQPRASWADLRGGSYRAWGDARRRHGAGL